MVSRMEILVELEKKKHELMEASQSVYVVNAGRMNHGKSSLLNSLLDRPAFKTADIRETKVQKQEKFFDNVYVIDTPGLDANDSDDKEAFAVYKKANYIIFVHNPKIGEMHSNELKHIAEIIKIMPSPDYFWQHFCLVLTFSEELETEQVATIKKQCIDSIRMELNASEFKVVLVSNSRYQKGKQETDEKKKRVFIAKSGIEELRNYIKGSIPIWQRENTSLQEQRFDCLAKKMIKKLLQEKSEMEKGLNEHHKYSQRQKENLEKQLTSILSRVNKKNDIVNRALCRQDDLRNQVQVLKDRHAREKY